ALVEASGVNTNNMAKESLYEMIRGCKLLASAAREEASGGARKRCTGILEGMSTSPRRDAQGWNKVKSATIESLSWGEEEDDKSVPIIEFFEFLYLMKLVRKIVREGQYDKLRSLFNYYDSDSSGQVARSELWRLFQDLGLQPRSRKEQLEMKQIFDEVDENGNGQFTFDEFVVLVQRSQEHLERLVRMSEEQYGESIGLSFKRVRELRKLFQDHKTEN
ncbi:unnamed protein product, partial [Polarella glacialis]